MVKISTALIVFLIMGAFVAIVAYLLILPFVENIFNLQSPRGGNRFIRYMTCSLAMCSHGYNTPTTIGTPLEFDEANKSKKGCNEVIKEMGERIGETFTTEQKLCGRKYALNFTFKKQVTYDGNLNAKFPPETGYASCGGGKTGWQTDVSCFYSWVSGGYLYKPCVCCSTQYKFYVRSYITPIPLMDLKTALPEGKLLWNEEGCGRTAEGHYGAIWIPKNLGGQCEAWDGDLSRNDLLNECTFEADEEIWIWSDNVGQIGYTYLPDTIPGMLIGKIIGMECFWWSPVDCQSVFICDSKP